MIAALDHTISDDDLRKTYRTALRRLANCWPMEDQDYQSALNWAMLKAVPRWAPERGTFLNMVIRYATREFRIVRHRKKLLLMGDAAGAERGLFGPPTPTPIPLTDFELLSFVAAHGRITAAKLLGMAAYRLRDRLDEVALRVKEGVAAGQS